MLLFFAGIIVQVMEQVSVLLIFIIIFSIYIKGTTTQDLYQSVFSNVSMPVAMLITFALCNIILFLGNDSLVYEVYVRSKPVKVFQPVTLFITFKIGAQLCY